VRAAVANVSSIENSSPIQSEFIGQALDTSERTQDDVAVLSSIAGRIVKCEIEIRKYMSLVCLVFAEAGKDGG
jgi:hypothetical protein